MKAQLIIHGLTVNVSATYKGDKKWNVSDRPGAPQNWNNHRVTVTTENGKCSFEFWASIAHPKIQSESDIIGALSCFVSDAMSSKDSFEDFCSELGYDSDSRKAYKIFKACERSYVKFERIIGDVDAYDFANALQELENA